MTDQEINIAIAEACGKRYHKPTEAEVASGSYYQYEPAYINDLNAMHEAAETLRGTPKFDRYIEILLHEYPLSGAIQATARQRAEAFLRTIGKWKD